MDYVDGLKVNEGLVELKFNFKKDVYKWMVFLNYIKWDWWCVIRICGLNFFGFVRLYDSLKKSDKRNIIFLRFIEN